MNATAATASISAWLALRTLNRTETSSRLPAPIFHGEKSTGGAHRRKQRKSADRHWSRFRQPKSANIPRIDFLRAWPLGPKMAAEQNRGSMTWLMVTSPQHRQKSCTVTVTLARS